MATKAKVTGRYVCLESGLRTICLECGATFLHVREEWVQKGQKLPRCERHETRLIPE